MKNILLTTTALVAFAGAAAADGHSSLDQKLSATLGYNNEAIGDNDGFYWEGNLKTTASHELDNGITAGAYFEVTVADEVKADDNRQSLALSSSDFVVSLTSDVASLYFGDTGTAADKHWASAGDMEADAFTSGTKSNVLRGDAKFAGVDSSVSYVWDDKANEAEQLSVGVAATFGVVTLTAGYQEDTKLADGDDDFSQVEAMGVSASGTFMGATVTGAFANATAADKSEKTSLGVQASYPVGPVTATAYYVNETAKNAAGKKIDGVKANYGVKAVYEANGIKATADYQDDQGTKIMNLDGSYDLSNNIKVMAGAEKQSGGDADYYVGGTYDLGGGASVLMTYAEDKDGSKKDEVGANDYQQGLTVEVSFAF